MSDLFLYLIRNCFNFVLFFRPKIFTLLCVCVIILYWTVYWPCFVRMTQHWVGWVCTEFSSNWLHFGCEFFSNTRLLCSCVCFCIATCYIGHHALYPCGLPSASFHSQGEKQRLWSSVWAIRADRRARVCTYVLEDYCTHIKWEYDRKCVIEKHK